jgi:hypothetical protein
MMVPSAAEIDMAVDTFGHLFAPHVPSQIALMPKMAVARLCAGSTWALTFLVGQRLGRAD